MRTLAEFKEILINYPYLTQDGEATMTCQIFKKCLKGSVKNLPSRAVVERNQDIINTNETLDEVVQETTSAIPGINAYDNQVE